MNHIIWPIYQIDFYFNKNNNFMDSITRFEEMEPYWLIQKVVVRSNQSLIPLLVIHFGHPIQHFKLELVVRSPGKIKNKE